ncbi:MAG: DUF1801 domain-containing protein [Rhizobiaceae bacterium]
MAEDADWTSIFEPAKPGLRDIASELRTMIRATLPDCEEVARPGYKAVSFGSGSSAMKDAVFYLMAHKNHVNLGFYNGADLSDPDGLLEGTDKAMRHVKVPDRARFEAIAALLRRAVKASSAPRP